MNKFKSHFEMNSRFRNGIFLLSLLSCGMLLIYFFYPFVSDDSQNNLIELVSYQKQIDSLKIVAQTNKREYQQRPFNPNFISDYKGYILGMSSSELNRLYTYRKKGKWINSVEDFQKVTKVSDSLLSVMSPLFKFPEWVNNNKSEKSNSKLNYKKLPFAKKKDINLVTAVELQEEIGIPDFVAERIIKYRVSIGGFVDDLQLKDITGLYEHQRNKILGLYTVKDPKVIKKINLNNATVKELMSVPYFDFETALEIRDLVEESGGISSFEELGKIEGFSLEKIDRIALYLTLK